MDCLFLMYRFFFNLVKEGMGWGEIIVEGVLFFFLLGNGNIMSKFESYKFLCILGFVLEVWGNFDLFKNYYCCWYWRLFGIMYFFWSLLWSFCILYIYNWLVIDLLILFLGWVSYCGILWFIYFDLNLIWYICLCFFVYY